MAFDLDKLIKDTTGGSAAPLPTVKVADGTASKAKAESGAYGTVR